MSDPVDVLRRWHEAINALDFDAIEAFFADDATYGSLKVGALRGKEQIMKAFRDYFAEYPDQVAVDNSLEKVGTDRGTVDMAPHGHQCDHWRETDPPRRGDDLSERRRQDRTRRRCRPASVNA